MILERLLRIHLVVLVVTCLSCSEPQWSFLENRRRDSAQRTPTREAVSLHIGVNWVDPSAYDGWDGKCEYCESNAEAMLNLAKGQGYKATLLRTSGARADALIKALDSAAEDLRNGGRFLLTYAGHGGQAIDTNGDECGGRVPCVNKDSTWSLYDRPFIDDEVRSRLTKFPKNVRILVISDSCHSGSVISFTIASDRLRSEKPARRQKKRHGVLLTPGRVQTTLDTAFQKRNTKIQERAKPAAIAAAAILVGACKDQQLAYDGPPYGFTYNLLQVWSDGAYRGTLMQFVEAIGRRTPYEQRPTFFKIGRRDAQFEKARPFS